MTTPSSDLPRLTLYETAYCPYCLRVRRAIEQLAASGVHLTIEYRDTMADPRALSELLAARGRRTVPVLRVQRSPGLDDGLGGASDEWMPESRDIIRYLEGLGVRATPA